MTISASEASGTSKKKGTQLQQRFKHVSHRFWGLPQLFIFPSCLPGNLCSSFAVKSNDLFCPRYSKITCTSFKLRSGHNTFECRLGLWRIIYKPSYHNFIVQLTNPFLSHRQVQRKNERSPYCVTFKTHYCYILSI